MITQAYKLPTLIPLAADLQRIMQTELSQWPTHVMIRRKMMNRWHFRVSHFGSEVNSLIRSFDSNAENMRMITSGDMT
jgi:hypothetical protein